MHIKNLLRANSLVIALIITIAIALLSLLKIGGPPISFTYIDKVEHAIAYMSLSFFWLLYYHELNKYAIHIIVLCILYGVLMEVLQGRTSYRTFDYMDMIANSMNYIKTF